MIDVTPVILTCNEEDNLARTLDALAWASDIVVVDSFSTDGTLAIAARYPNVRVYRRRFDNHAAQWSFAIDRTDIGAEWILTLDADHVASTSLRDELARVCSTGGASAYTAEFRYCVWGRPLRASLYPPHIVLFRRGRGRFQQCGHTQRLLVEGEVGALATKFDHDDRKPLSRWLEAQMRYARLEADYLGSRRADELRPVDRLRRTGVLSPFATLFHALAVKGLALEGWRGWHYALQRALFEILFCLAWIERRHAPLRDLRVLGGEKFNHEGHKEHQVDAGQAVR